MTPLLAIHELTKHYRHPWTLRRVTVLERLSLSLDDGEIFGLIGHNGAGKTTTMKLLVGLLRPSGGSITFAGRPLDREARGEIGFLPEQPYFHDHLTVDETLAFFARLYGLGGAALRERVAEVRHDLRLEEKRRASVRTLSKGTLQRLGVAQAILARPRLVILDEPMSGLDPAGRHHMRELIRALRGQGTTVIFSSHVLPDAEALCDRVGIITRGRLREVVEPQFETDLEGYLMAVRRVSAEALSTLESIADRPPAAAGDTWQVHLPGPEALRAALDAVQGAGGFVESLQPVRPSLEERFLAWMGDDTP